MTNTTPPPGDGTAHRPIFGKKPASVMRQHTQHVRNAVTAIQHLEEQYFTTLKRAETAYFEGLKRITDALAAEAASEAAEAAPTQPS